MMLFALGLNHFTAPLAVREQMAFHAGELRQALGDLTGGGRALEAAILSTCNRAELYCLGEEPRAAAVWLA
ncbi:MAG: glutamyl-tRNA reductase, partial [Candidatus Accumulibacter sp.]|nr:glutamyl-tRNA reductase [Accumulibacter sp.]